MALFQDNIVLKRPRMRENKCHRFVPFFPNALQKIPKKLQKNSKNLKIPLRLHLKPEQVGKGRERKKINIVVPFRSYPTRIKKFQK